MELWYRALISLGIFVLLETVDHYVEAFSSPWWLSLIMALLLSIIDIIFIFCLDVITDDN